MLIDNSLSITIACVIIIFLGFIWFVDIIRIVFANNTDKIMKIAFNAIKWLMLMTILMWVINHFKSYIG